MTVVEHSTTLKSPIMATRDCTSKAQYTHVDPYREGGESERGMVESRPTNRQGRTVCSSKTILTDTTGTRNRRNKKE